jgi:hypothetical protein
MQTKDEVAEALFDRVRDLLAVRTPGPRSPATEPGPEAADADGDR